MITFTQSTVAWFAVIGIVLILIIAFFSQALIRAWVKNRRGTHTIRLIDNLLIPPIRVANLDRARQIAKDYLTGPDRDPAA